MSKLMKLTTALLATMMLVGCWDSVEINNRSVILEFAVDKNMDHKYDPHLPIDDQSTYNVIYTIPDMAKLSGTESLATDVETSIMVQAPTIAASIDDLETKTKNTISLSHVKGFLIGENLLKDKVLFKQMIDSVARDRVIARNVPLLAIKGDARKVASIDNAQQPVTGLYIMNFFNNKERPRSYFKIELLGNLIRDIDDTRVATMPIFHLPGESPKGQGQIDQASGESGGQGKEQEGSDASGKANEIDISGGAVIKDYELVDYITKEEVRGQLLIQGEAKNSPVTILFEESPITYTIKEEKSKISFENTSEGPVCYVKIETKGDISEYTSQTEDSLFDKETKNRVQEQVEQEIIRQAGLAVIKAKDIKTDFMQIGLELYRKHPKWWAEYEDNWHEEIFVKMPINIEVQATIQNIGILE